MPKTVAKSSYGTTHLAVDDSVILQIVLAVNVLTIIGIPFFGWLSDRIGRKPVFVTGVVGMAVLPYAWFAALGTRSFGWMLAGSLLLFLPYTAAYGKMPVFFAHVFPPAVRYTGMSLGYTLGTVIGSALAPIIATWLLGASGGWLLVAVYMSRAGVVSAVAALFLREWRVSRGVADAPAVEVAS